MGKRTTFEPLSLRDAGLISFMWTTLFVMTLLAVKETTVSTGQLAVWPADALCLAFMLGPSRRRPILALLVCRSAAAAISFLTAFPLAPSFLVNSASIAGMLFVYFGLKKFLDTTNIHKSNNLLILFVLSMFGSLISATLQGYFLSIFYKIDIVSVIESCFAANWSGYVIIVPLVLIIYNRLNGVKMSAYKPMAISSSLVSYTVLTWTVFQFPLPLLFILPLGLMALAYLTDLGAVACGVSITAIISIVATVSGHGPIAAAPLTPSYHLLFLQFFLAVITAFILPMAARMSENKQLRLGLIAATSAAEAANQAKSQFLATISHEIRTPLNGVLGMAQVMATAELAPAQADRLRIIRRSGEVLLSILNDVLDLSKIEAGKLTIEAIEFDLVDMLRTTTHMFSPLAKEKGLTFSQTFDEVSGLYLGDPTRIRQIVSNLLSNALKFTDSGEIHVSSRYEDGVFHLSVRDTGIGIPTDKLNRLFAKFTQADETTTRRFGGTGLGLSICKDLSALMGGVIEVESREGEGSCFTLSIPLPRLGDLSPVIAEPVEAMDISIAGLRVLAAEDNPTNQLVLRTLLEMAGIEVSIAANGVEALTLWEKQAWDVILMDVQMPIMDGPDAAREIRERERLSGRRRTPIIALTANTMSHQIEGYLATGMDSHVGKPIEAEALFRAIAAARAGVEASGDQSLKRAPP